jgi:hypothetical protein
VLYGEHMSMSWSQMLSPILGLSKDIMSRGPHVVYMECREIDEHSIALEGAFF